MTLPTNERNAIIEYRKEKAYQTIEEAKEVASHGFWSLAAQRLYYSTFYAQSALLISKKMQASTHAGVKTLIGLHFVKSGVLTKEEGIFLSNLFALRQTSDYGDLFDFKKEDVEPLIQPTIELVKKIIGLIVE